MLGDAGVGKTALVNQFMTSEYMHTYDASLGKLIALSLSLCLSLDCPGPSLEQLGAEYTEWVVIDTLRWNLCVSYDPQLIPIAAGFRLRL